MYQSLNNHSRDFPILSLLLTSHTFQIYSTVHSRYIILLWRKNEFVEYCQLDNCNLLFSYQNLCNEPIWNFCIASILSSTGTQLRAYLSEWKLLATFLFTTYYEIVSVSVQWSVPGVDGEMTGVSTGGGSNAEGIGTNIETIYETSSSTGCGNCS